MTEFDPFWPPGDSWTTPKRLPDDPQTVSKRLPDDPQTTPKRPSNTSQNKGGQCRNAASFIRFRRGPSGALFHRFRGTFSLRFRRLVYRFRRCPSVFSSFSAFVFVTFSSRKGVSAENDEETMWALSGRTKVLRPDARIHEALVRLLSEAPGDSLKRNIRFKTNPKTTQKRP